MLESKKKKTMGKGKPTKLMRRKMKLAKKQAHDGLVEEDEEDVEMEE